MTVSKLFSNPKVYAIYRILYNFYGPQHWWPADNEFEVLVGAILTQNTAWRNIEKTINNLKQKKILSPICITKLSTSELEELIRSSGFYRIKARRLKALVNYLVQKYSGQINKLKRQNVLTLRKELLNIYGIGEETADSILLYALDKPVFVVDAYTKRIFSRHRYIDSKASYTTIQKYFIANLPKSIKIYNEYHALLVKLAKDYCRTKPLCQDCPIKGM